MACYRDGKQRGLLPSVKKNYVNWAIETENLNSCTECINSSTFTDPYLLISIFQNFQGLDFKLPWEPWVYHIKQVVLFSWWCILISPCGRGCCSHCRTGTCTGSSWSACSHLWSERTGTCSEDKLQHIQHTD